MRTGSSDVFSLRHGRRSRLDNRLKNGRKSRFRWLDLEGLESQHAAGHDARPCGRHGQWLADRSDESDELPDATTTVGGNANSPTVAINPYDSQEVVAVWSVDISNLAPAPLTTEIVQGELLPEWRAKLDGAPRPERRPRRRLRSSRPTHLYPDSPDSPLPSGGLSRVSVLTARAIFICSIPSWTAPPFFTQSGAVALNKYNFVGNSAAGGTGVNLDINSQIIDQWINGPADIDAVIAVDAGTYPNATATSTPPAGIPQDTNVNKVYVAWATNDIEPADPTVVANDFNPNRAMMLVSSNGGASFGGATILSPHPRQRCHRQHRQRIRLAPATGDQLDR